jgi:magnesium-transporting ATPase (P-type)
VSEATSPVPKDLPERDWHALPAEEAAKAFRSDPEHGLSDSEAAERQRIFGENRLTPATERSALRRLISQFDNLFIYLLLAAAVVTALLGEWLDSGVILGVVLIIAIIGFVQEGRAEKALEAVRSILSHEAVVRRDGRRRRIDTAALVPGDIVLLEAGDRVPADLRLIRVRNLQTQEAALTGESTGIEKSTDPVDAEAELGDRRCLAFSGTVVSAGTGVGIVIRTGDATEIGRISGMIAEVKELRTPLMRRLDAFTRTLSGVILSLAVFTFLVGVLAWGRDWGEMFFAAVSIAVAAIPEGLPAVMTVTLAIGVERMARRNAIIRRLPAVETLGSVTTICADKTGTLTRNEMTVRTLRTADATYEVEGVGYAPEGAILRDGEAVEPGDDPVLARMLQVALLCNDGGVERRGDAWEPEGDPTEAALVVLARKAGLDPDAEAGEMRRLDAIPFASERRYMATLNHDHHGRHLVLVKGAPERILSMCRAELRDGEEAPLEAERWRELADEIAGRGQRLLAAAVKEIGETSELKEEEAEEGLLMLGLFGLIDPPREEAITSVRICHEAGIDVKMITGDHAKTAAAVARELGLTRHDRPMTGREVESMSDEDLKRSVRETDVFARASPEHKLRLVRALQAEGEIVAMTGDGVNDAPALKSADVGIAMGRKGTEAAREASAMVLADDNFASIQRAVEEGRTVYDNLRKAILFILPTNAAQALIIVTAILFGLTLPVTPVQILWVNMVTAVTLGIAFAWEKAEGDVMAHPPHPTDEPLLTAFVIWRVAFVGLILLAGAGLLFFREEANPDVPLEYARTLAVNALVMGQIFYLLNTRFFHAPALTREGLLGNRVALIAIGICLLLQLILTYLPVMNTLFDTMPLGVEGWALCIGVGLGVFLLVEIEKAVIRRGLHPLAVTAGRGEGEARPAGERT